MGEREAMAALRRLLGVYRADNRNLGATYQFAETAGDDVRDELIDLGTKAASTEATILALLDSMVDMLARQPGDEYAALLGRIVEQCPPEFPRDAPARSS